MLLRQDRKKFGFLSSQPDTKVVFPVELIFTGGNDDENICIIHKYDNIIWIKIWDEIIYLCLLTCCYHYQE